LCIAHSCSPRLAADFHQNHTTSPLAIFVGDPLFAEFLADFHAVWCSSVKAAAVHIKYELPLYIAIAISPNSVIRSL
jgi:hypothetical protein